MLENMIDCFLSKVFGRLLKTVICEPSLEVYYMLLDDWIEDSLG